MYCNMYRQTALAILSDEEQGLDALKCIVKEKGEEISPLRLLIKEMPGEKCSEIMLVYTLYKTSLLHVQNRAC